MRRSRRGFTLIEVLVAMVLLLIAISGVYAVMLTALTSTGSNEQRYQANLASRNLAETLKNYVGATHDAAPGPGSPPWHLPGDPCNGCPPGAVGAPPNCWALAACTHDATSHLSQALQTAGFRMLYTIEDKPVPGAAPATFQQVTINVEAP